MSRIDQVTGLGGPTSKGRSNGKADILRQVGSELSYSIRPIRSFKLGGKLLESAKTLFGPLASAMRISHKHI